MSPVSSVVLYIRQYLPPSPRSFWPASIIGRRRGACCVVAHVGPELSCVGCGIGRTTVPRTTTALLPFYAVMVLVLFLVVYLPGSPRPCRGSWGTEDRPIRQTGEFGATGRIGPTVWASVTPPLARQQPRVDRR